MAEPTGPLWRDRNFATYWSAQSVSQLGDRISELAIPLIAVTMLHSSPTVVGLLTAAVWAPNLVSLFVGAWVDQQPRKQRLLIWADLIRAVAVLTLPVAHWIGASRSPSSSSSPSWPAPAACSTRRPTSRSSWRWCARTSSSRRTHC